MCFSKLQTFCLFQNQIRFSASFPSFFTFSLPRFLPSLFLYSFVLFQTFFLTFVSRSSFEFAIFKRSNEFITKIPLSVNYFLLWFSAFWRFNKSGGQKRGLSAGKEGGGKRSEAKCVEWKNEKRKVRGEEGINRREKKEGNKFIGFWVRLLILKRSMNEPM